MRDEPVGLDKTLDMLWDYVDDLGLDPHPVIFEIVPSEQLYELASYGAPGRYRHWSFGKKYNKQKQQYDQGKGRILELVVNANPALAYLLKNNHNIYHKLVCAHVLGHSDFFKNNMYFKNTDKNKPEILRSHRDRIAAYEEEHGVKNVERILTMAHALQRQRPLTPSTAKKSGSQDDNLGNEDSDGVHQEYEDLFPDDYFESGESDKKELFDDLLKFIIERSNALEDWERDILSIVHDEQEFFLPNFMTKTINEGWSVFIHTKLMDRLELTEHEQLRYSRKQGEVLSASKLRMNKYRVGYEMWEELESQEGFARCLEVRKNHSDSSFYRNYLTDDLIEKLDLYSIDWKHKKTKNEIEPTKAKVESKDPAFIRQQLANQVYHHNIPRIAAKDTKPGNELTLIHRDDQPLKKKSAQKVLGYIEKLWGNDVTLIFDKDKEETLKASKNKNNKEDD